MSIATLVTAEQLMRMPEDGCRYELVSGELKKTSPPGFIHGVVLLRSGRLLGNYVEDRDLGLVTGGDTSFLLARDPDTVRAPDVAFVRKERLVRNPPTEGLWPGVPDLAVEVVSPNDTLREVNDKARAWLVAGVRMVWVLNPARRTATVYRPATDILGLTADDELDGQDVLPGFHCRVADIFLRL